LLITDYICGPYHLHSKHFKQYIAERGYTLLTVEDYGKVFNIQNLLSHILICFQTLENVGFKNVQAIDKTDQFLTILQKELNKFESEKNSFLKDFPKSDYDDISEGWKDKLERCGERHQRWGLFLAQK